MAKAGRKRALVDRERNGRAQREKVKPHIQAIWEYAECLRRTDLRTELGRLLHAGKIDGPMYDAGVAYRNAREDYRLAFGFASAHPRGQDVTAVHGMAIEPSEEFQRERRERAEKRLTMMEACVGHGTKELAAVQWVCGYGLHHEGEAMLIALVSGLRRIALWQKGRR